MDEALRFAYQNADYLVCVDTVEAALAHPAPATLAHPWAAWACIRIDQPLPASLQQRVGKQSWGFITAWNPRSETREPAENLAAQRELFVALQALPENIIFPAAGVGANGWHEPSFFVIGASQAALDALGRCHQQNAYVYGHAEGVARLRCLQNGHGS
jgi:hypothetical protein